LVKTALDFGSGLFFSVTVTNLAGRLGVSHGEGPKSAKVAKATRGRGDEIIV